MIIIIKNIQYITLLCMYYTDKKLNGNMTFQAVEIFGH